MAMDTAHTVTGAIHRWSQDTPEKMALVDAQQDRTLTYGELNHLSHSWAVALHRSGIAKGDLVAYLMDDPLSIVALILALGSLGAAFTPLNPRTRQDEWVQQLQDAGASTVVYDHKFSDALMTLTSRAKSIKQVFPSLTGIQSHDYSEAPNEANEEMPLALLYTSGTTGRPKGAWHSQKTLWGWNHSLIQSLHLTPDDRIFNPYPYFHMGGIGFTLSTLQIGATTIIDTPFNAHRAIATLIKHHCTTAFMVPTMAQAILDLPDSEKRALNASALHQLVTSSAPLLDTTAQSLVRTWPNIQLSILYSATEAIFAAHQIGSAEPLCPLCVGRPAFGMEVVVCNTDGERCPPKTIGTIYASGISVFAGYHKRPASKGIAIPGHWHTCNDLGYLTEAGLLVLVDRAQDLINSGGEKISSLEIENILRAHPQVHDVAVVGVKDRYWGERIHAVIVPKCLTLSKQQVTEYARMHLPTFKVPKSIEFVAELPRGDTGKVLKQVLRREH